MQPESATSAPPRRGGLKNVGVVLSVVALILGGAALGVAFVVPGPAGPQGVAGAAGANGANGTNGANGVRGPTGPAGNGTLMTSMRGGLMDIGSGCNNQVPALNLTVPSKGNISFTASVTIGIAHTSGSADEVDVFVSAPAPLGNCYLFGGEAWVPSAAGSDTYYISVPVAVVIPVTAGGFYSYSIGVIQSYASGTANAVVSYASATAVFYPS